MVKQMKVKTSQACEEYSKLEIYFNILKKISTKLLKQLWLNKKNWEWECKNCINKWLKMGA